MKFSLWLWLLAGTPSFAGETFDSIQGLAERLTGIWSSAEQAEQDESFSDVSVVYCPVEFRSYQDNEAKYLYYEQALGRSPERPYRRGFTKISRNQDGSLISQNLEISGDLPINLCDSIEYIVLPPESIGPLKCTVRLFERQGVYTGGTRPEGCPNDFRGASFVTNEVAIYFDEMISWDRGWNSQGDQVWGSEVGPYLFRKK